MIATNGAQIKLSQADILGIATALTSVGIETEGVGFGLMRSNPPPQVIGRLRELAFKGNPHRAERANPKDRRQELDHYKRQIEKHEEEEWKLDMARRRALLDEHEIDCFYTSGRRRSASTLLRDGVLTFSFLKERAGRVKRMDALVEVLCSVPEEDYKKLGESFRTGGVLLSLPKNTTLGHISRIAGDRRREFYLAPILEERTAAWVNHVAAHELAHLLHHYDLAGSGERMEIEADATARRWGYPVPL